MIKKYSIYNNKKEIFLDEEDTYEKLKSLFIINDKYIKKNRGYYDFFMGFMWEISKEDTMKIVTNSKGKYITPLVAMLLYELILEKVKFWDRNVYYNSYNDEDIIFILTLKESLKKIHTYLVSQSEETIISSFLDSHSPNYHIGYNANLIYWSQFIKTISNQYFDDTSYFISEIKNPLKDAPGNNEFLIEKTLNYIEKYLNRLLSLPVPIETNSLLSKEISNIAGVISNSTTLWGNLYKLNNQGDNLSVSKDLIEKYSVKIKSITNLLNSFGENKRYAGLINNVISIINSDEKTKDITYKQIRNELNKKIQDEIKLAVKDLGGEDTINKIQPTDNPEFLFINATKEIINRYKKEHEELSKNQKIAITKYTKGAIKKKNLISASVINYISNFITDTIYLPMLKTDSGAEKFSVIFLNKLAKLNIIELYENSAENLFETGEFSETRDLLLKRYDEKFISYLRMIINIASTNEIDKKMTASDNYNKAYINETLDEIEKNNIDEKELIGSLDEILAFGFLNDDVKKEETVKDVTLRKIKYYIDKLEERRGKNILKLINLSSKGLSYSKELKTYRTIEMILINLSEELNDRLIIITLVESLVSRCKYENNKYISPYLIKKNEIATDPIRMSMVAAVRHLYNDTNISISEGINLYHTIILEHMNEEYFIRALAALYWVIFYSPTVSNFSQTILPVFDKKNNTLSYGEHYAQADNVKKTRLKALTAFTTISKIVRFFDVYLEKQNNFETLLEAEISGEHLGNYLSIVDIKKRSSFDGNSLKEFSDQFVEYKQNIPKDIIRIKGNTLRKSGVDLEQLVLKPKAVYRYKHLNTRNDYYERSSNSFSIEGRPDDLLIFILQDNSYLLSFATNIYNEIVWIPEKLGATPKEIMSLDGVDTIIGNPLAFMFDLRQNEKQASEDFEEDIKFRYKLDEFNYNISEPEPNFLLIDIWKLREKPHYGIISDLRRPMALFKYEGKLPAESPNKVIDAQLTNFLNEASEILKHELNDAEDVTGVLLGFIPFASLIRKIYNDLPPDKADYGLAVLDAIMLGFGASTKIFSTTAQQGIKTTISKAIAKELAKNSGKMTFSAFAHVTMIALKAVSRLSATALKIMMKELVHLTPLPLAYSLIKLPYYGLRSSLHYISSASKQIDLWSKIANNPEEYKIIATLETQGRYVLRAQELIEDISGQKTSIANIPPKNGIGIFYAPTKENEGAILHPVAFHMDEQPINNIINDLLNNHLINEVLDQVALIDEIKLSNLNKIHGANVRLVEARWDRAGVLQMFQNQHGCFLYGSDQEGLNVIKNNHPVNYWNRARDVLSSVDTARTLSAKASNILGRVVLFDDQTLRENLRSDIRNYLDYAADDHVVDDIIRTLHERNSIVHNILNHFYSEDLPHADRFNSPDIYFFASEHHSIAMTYAGDATRTVFYNLAYPYINPYKTILHEVSHQSATDDFLYMSSIPGIYTPIKERISSWTKKLILIHSLKTSPSKK